MSKLRYSVWEEDGLHHWTVHFRRGPVCGYGTATGLIRARAEAIAFGLDPSRAEHIARAVQRRQEELLLRAHRARVDADQRVVIANSSIPDWEARCDMSRALVEKSREAIAQSRRLLQAR